MDATELGLPPDVIDQILSGNMQATEASKQSREEALEKMREICANYRGVFNTPAGQYVLAHLRSLTIDQSTFVPGIAFPGADGLSAAQQGFMREGQNTLVREIERYIRWEEPSE